MVNFSKIRPPLTPRAISAYGCVLEKCALRQLSLLGDSDKKQIIWEEATGNLEIGNS